METPAKVFLGFAVLFGMIGLAMAGAMSQGARSVAPVTARPVAPVTQPHNFSQDTTDHQWKPTAKWERERGPWLADQEAAIRASKLELARNPASAYKFSSIHPGMSYAQVVAIMGVDGTVLSESDLAGYHTLMLSWQNQDGGNMNVMIQNNRVVSKAQFGLR